MRRKIEQETRRAFSRNDPEANVFWEVMDSWGENGVEISIDDETKGRIYLDWDKARDIALAILALNADMDEVDEKQIGRTLLGDNK